MRNAFSPPEQEREDGEEVSISAFTHFCLSVTDGEEGKKSAA